MATSANRRLSKNSEAMKIIAESSEQGLTDKQIQSRLIRECGYEWSIDTIRRARRKMGNVKIPGQTSSVETVDIPMMSNPPHGLSDNEKVNWFREQFKKTHLYRTIQKQLEPDEVTVYLDDFGLLCCQFEDIVVSEFMQIDDFLKHRILINRQLILGRSLQRSISDLELWFAENPRLEDEDKEKVKFRISQQRELDGKYKLQKEIQDRYDALIKERHKIHKSLAATRQDRLEELRGGQDTFIDLVVKLQHSKEERDRQGKLAELTKMAANDIKKKFREAVEFPDGSIDSIIVDAETDFGDEN